MVDRIVRAIRLDWTVFREIAEDQDAMTQAAIIVVVSTFLSALGAGFASPRGFFAAFFSGWILGIVVSWIGWAIVTYLVGVYLFQGRTNIPEMMRVLGYAMAPNLLGFFQFIPCVGWVIAIIGGVLSFIAGFIAVREAMEFDTGKAIVTVLISWVVSFPIMLIVRSIL